MTIEIDQEIMTEIGLGSPSGYQWYNGSGSCGGVRRAAAKALPEALLARGMAPDRGLMNLVAAVAHKGERPPEMVDDRYVLTRTYQCISDVIRYHTGPHVSEGERSASERAYIVEHWEPPGKMPKFDSRGRLIGTLRYDEKGGFDRNQGQGTHRMIGVDGTMVGWG